MNLMQILLELHTCHLSACKGIEICPKVSIAFTLGKHIMTSVSDYCRGVNMSFRMAVLFVASTVSWNALAGNVLFVNNNGSDVTVPAALATDGHVVTSTNLDPSAPTANTFFQNANLGSYCAVVWSAAYARGVADLSGATTTLSNWVNSGGHVAILSPDGVAKSGTNPNGQPNLLALLGASGGWDGGYNFSTVPNIANSVTTGLVDIRNTQPSVPGDTDTVCGPLVSGTVGLVTSPDSVGASGDACYGQQLYAWTLRTLGSGQVAFFTSGNFNGSDTDEPNWSNTTIPGDGVYNAGLRNFVYSACSPKAITSVPTLNGYMTVVLSALISIVGLGLWWRRRLHS